MEAALHVVAKDLVGEPLPVFAERELAKARAENRAYLRSILTGRSASDIARIPMEEAPTQASSIVAAEGVEVVRDELAEAPEAALVDSTTLFPRAEAQEALPRKKSFSPVTAALSVIALCAAGLTLAYVSQTKTSIEAIEPLPEPADHQIRIVERPEAPAGQVELAEAAATDDETGAGESSTAEAEEPSGASEPDSPRAPPADEPGAGEASEPTDDGTAVAKTPTPARKVKRPRRNKPVPPRLKKKAPSVEAPTPDTFGFVTIGASPYARVRIDGKEIGVTPIVRRKIPTGKHKIELLAPDTGEVRAKRILKLAEGKHERITIK